MRPESRVCPAFFWRNNRTGDMASPRKPRKPRNVVAFPKKPVRIIKTKGVEVFNPYEQFSKALEIMVERDGHEATFHTLADFADRMRRIMAKEMLMRSSG